MDNIMYRIGKLVAEFESRTGVRPNRIIIGVRVAQKLIAEYSAMRVCADDTTMIMGMETETDYKNPDRIAVGYMMETEVKDVLQDETM